MSAHTSARRALPPAASLSRVPAIGPRHVFGWRKEEELKELLELVLDEPLRKMAARFSYYDFEGTKFRAELKCRRTFNEKGYFQDSNSYPTWLVPASKTWGARDETKTLIIFYYYEGDNTLWYIQYDKELFATFKCVVPSKHTADHYYIPKECFTRVEVVEETEGQ